VVIWRSRIITAPIDACVISERRRPTKRASLYSHMGKQNYSITREILISAIWFLKQKAVSERRGETRREASRRSTQRAFCYSHMGKQNNSITREILNLAMWIMEQKVIVFRCRTYIRDEPARPSPTRPGHEAL